MTTTMLLLLPALSLAQQPDDAFVRHAVSTEQLITDMRVLTGVDPVPGEAADTFIESRAVAHPDILLAEQYLIAAFEEMEGVEVWTEAVAMDTDYPSHNVVADLPGNPDLDIVVVGAHYDCTSNLEQVYDPVTDPAPGADDNASGTAAVLAIARVLSSWEPGFRRPVRFILFTGEEDGLLGAYEHVAQMDENGEDVHVILNLDMVGYNPDETWEVTAFYQRFWAEEVASFEQASVRIGSPLTVLAVEDLEVMGAMFSDHYPFWSENHPGLHINSGPLSPGYHTYEGNMNVIDPEYLTEVTALTASSAATFADVFPGKRELGGCNTSGAAVSPLLALLLAGVASRRRRGPAGR